MTTVRCTKVVMKIHSMRTKEILKVYQSCTLGKLNSIKSKYTKGILRVYIKFIEVTLKVQGMLKVYSSCT